MHPTDRSSPQRPRGLWDWRWGADTGGEVRQWGHLLGPGEPWEEPAASGGKDAPIREEVSPVLRPPDQDHTMP